MDFPMNEAGEFVASNDGNASENAGAPSLITAAGGLDNVEVEGQTVDRRASSGVGLAHSCIVATGWLAALTNTKTISLAHDVQYSADDSTWDTAVEVEAATVQQTATASTNYRGVAENDINLRQQKRYLRINVTLDLNAANTDTALFFTIVTLGGWTQVPQ